MKVDQAPDDPVVPAYSIIIPQETLSRAADYLRALQSNRAESGAHLRACLQDIDIRSLKEFDLLAKLFDTKQPQIFAELAVSGEGADWNLTELGLLGDISVAVPVTIYDDGHHDAPTRHEHPFAGTLLFTPGALLRNGRGKTPADWNETVTKDGQLSTEAYYNLYRRRLLPVFQYLNFHAAKSRTAFVTMPGLGCGQFAGPFRGQLESQLQAVLQRFLTEYGGSFPNLKAVYYDSYSAGQNDRYEIQGISLMVRPLMQPGNQKKSQLCPPVAYAEPGDDFSGCTLYSFVAWDHVSWPGNDFFSGSRTTDDGVKAAATSSMAVLTGGEGRYDPNQGKYQPPEPFNTWNEVVGDCMRKRGLRLWHAQAVWKPRGPE